MKDGGFFFHCNPKNSILQSSGLLFEVLLNLFKSFFELHERTLAGSCLVWVSVGDLAVFVQIPAPANNYPTTIKISNSAQPLLIS